MYFELWMLMAASILGFVQLFAASLTCTAQRGAKWNMGPRDEPPRPLTGKAARLERIFANFKETFPFFVAAVTIVVCAGHLGHLSGFGSTLYVLSRVVYIPMYLFGVTFIRSVVWLCSVAGIALVFAQVLF